MRFPTLEELGNKASHISLRYNHLMGCGVAVICTSCFLREPPLEHSTQLCWMDHDYFKPVMLMLSFYANSLSRDELGTLVFTQTSKVGRRAWKRWSAGIILQRVCSVMREPFSPYPPFFVCVLFYVELKL